MIVYQPAFANCSIPNGSSIYINTDDYMCAVRLVGGLTKWEVLKLVKAGFKHAFLPKNEIEMLLKEAEKEVYQLVTGDPGRVQLRHYLMGSWTL